MSKDTFSGKDEFYTIIYMTEDGLRILCMDKEELLRRLADEDDSLFKRQPVNHVGGYLDYEQTLELTHYLAIKGKVAVPKAKMIAVQFEVD